MNINLTLVWLWAAIIRAIKTVAQTALGMFTVGASIGSIQWKYIASVALVAGLYSILTSLVGLPEVAKTDGTLQVDTSDPTKDTYRLVLTDELQNLAAKKSITLTVDPDVKLP